MRIGHTNLFSQENFMAELRTVTVIFISVSSLLAKKTGLKSLRSATIKKLLFTPQMV